MDCSDSGTGLRLQRCLAHNSSQTVPALLNQLQLGIDVGSQLRSWIAFDGYRSPYPVGPHREVALAQGGDNVVARGEVLVDRIPGQSRPLTERREGQPSVAVRQQDGFGRVEDLTVTERPMSGDGLCFDTWHL